MKVGTKISKQMNTWALLSNWSQDDFHSEPLVNVFEFFGKSSWFQLCPESKTPFFCGNPSLIYFFAQTALSSFQLMLLFSWDAFSFLFFFIFYCFLVRLRTWTLFKMNKFFISLRKKIFSSSTYIWSKWTFKVRNVGQVQVYTKKDK